jgi:hypothetical protein
MTTVNDIILTTTEIIEAVDAVIPDIYGYDMDTYLLSMIVDDQTYRIQTLASQKRHQCKLKAHRARDTAHPAITTTPAPDPFISVLHSFEEISSNEFVGTTLQDDSNRVDEMKRP